MGRTVRIIGIISVVVGGLAVVVGSATYYVVYRELSDEKITVSDDATNLAGDDVDGPFSAYSESMAIKEHALEAGDGKTYAELDRDDPTRDTVMQAAFLRSSLFTSVLAFGVAALIVGLGVMMVLIGVGFISIGRAMAAAEGPPPTRATAATAPPSPPPSAPPSTQAPAT